MPTPAIENPFVYLSFLAAPAILTNASTVLALGTSNRLARAADRARAAATAIVGADNADDMSVKLQQVEFVSASRRARLLVMALRRFYLAAGCFAAGTCVALIGAFAHYMGITALNTFTQVVTVLIAVAGVGGLAHGALTLLYETQIALRALSEQEEAIRRWETAQAVKSSPTAGL